MFAVGLLIAAAALSGPLADPTGIAFDPAGNMWVCNYTGHTLVEYAPSQLEASGAPVPTRIVQGVRGPNNIAVDIHGNVWAAEYDGGSVAEYRRGRLVVRVRFLAYSAPTGLAFDSHGMLWVTDQRSGSLAGFRPAQLRRSGMKNPARTIALPGGRVANNQSVAFDRAGRMWVAQWGADRVLEFAGPGGRLLRTLKLSGRGPLGVTVGSDGRFWVTDAASSELTAFTASGPPVTYTSSDFANPHSSALDSSGRLWITNSSDRVLGFDASAFGAAGSVTPSIAISNPSSS